MHLPAQKRYRIPSSLLVGHCSRSLYDEPVAALASSKGAETERFSFHFSWESRNDLEVRLADRVIRSSFRLDGHLEVNVESEWIRVRQVAQWSWVLQNGFIQFPYELVSILDQKKWKACQVTDVNLFCPHLH